MMTVVSFMEIEILLISLSMIPTVGSPLHRINTQKRTQMTTS